MAWKFFSDTIKVGDLVYMPYTPQNPGIVRKIVSKEYSHTSGTLYTDIYNVVVEVEWLKKSKKYGKISTIDAMSLVNFEELVNEHKRKYESQSAMIKQLREM